MKRISILLAFDHVKISWDNAGQVKKTGGNH